jgi:hypothetical protein
MKLARHLLTMAFMAALLSPLFPALVLAGDLATKQGIP